VLIAIHPTTYRSGGFLAHGMLKNHKKEALGNGLISESLLSFLILFIIF